jgi:lipocalin-like protein
MERHPGCTQEGNMRDRLIGTWKLVSAVREDMAGHKVDQLGPSPTGYINYAPDGRMMALIARGARTKPAGAQPTPPEVDALFKSMLSYAGTYTIDGDEVTHHVDVSWNESWTGTKQTRVFRFDGERLQLATKPSPDPVDGVMSVRRMVWEKVT